MRRAVHVLNDGIEPPISGADIRNHAIDTALAGLFDLTTLVLEDLLAIRRIGDIPTVLDIGKDDTAAIASRVLEAEPEVIVLEGVAMLALARRLADCANNGASERRPRLIVDMHNVESDLLARTLRADFRVRDVAGLLTGQRQRTIDAARAADRDIAILADELWLCSEDDRARLHTLLDTPPPIRVVPNPVPQWCAIAREVPTRPTGEVSALFVGHLGYRPNILAARRLIDRIWPRIRTLEPDGRLVIAGRRPHKSVGARAGTVGLTVVADPVDLAPLYAGASVALLPLTVGGGTRIKALEALATGVPMVATAAAVEGLGLLPGRHYVQAESDDAFAAAVVDLHRSPNLRDAIVDEGRALVRRNFGPEATRMAITRAFETGPG